MASRDYEPRRAEPGTVFDYTTEAGRQRHLKADASGAVWPRNDADQAVLQSFGLGVHAEAKEKAAKPVKAKAASDRPATPPPAPAAREVG